MKTTDRTLEYVAARKFFVELGQAEELLDALDKLSVNDKNDLTMMVENVLVEELVTFLALRNASDFADFLTLTQSNRLERKIKLS